MVGHLVKYGKHRTRRSYASIKEVLDVPNLIEIQTASYQWFLNDGIKEMFGDIMPIDDFQEMCIRDRYREGKVKRTPGGE